MKNISYTETLNRKLEISRRMAEIEKNTDYLLPDEVEEYQELEKEFYED